MQSSYMNNVLPTQNLAPAKPLFGLKDSAKSTPVYIQDGIRELFKHYLTQNEEIWKEIAHTTEITSNFIQGKQLWMPNYWTNKWSIQPVNLADSNKISAINIMQFYATGQIKMMISSNPDLEPTDEFRRKEYRDRVKIAKSVWNYYESKFYTKWFNMQQAMHALISGTYFEMVEYDHLKKGQIVFREIFGSKDVEVSHGAAECMSCEEQGPYNSFSKEGMPVCPSCQSNEVVFHEAPYSQKFDNVLMGVQPFKLGDLVLKSIPIQAVRFDTKVRFEDSSWGIIREEMPMRKLEYFLGADRLHLEHGLLDDGLRSLRAISEAGNTLSGKIGDSSYKSSMTKDTVILEKFFVKPQDVHHIINTVDAVTVSGEVIPAGTRLSDFCPEEGMTIIGVNEMQYILGIYRGIHHGQMISSGVYHARYNSGLGRGSEDTVEIQKRFNRFDSQNVKFMDASSTPAKLYIKGAISEQHVKRLGFPNAAIPINQEVASALGTKGLVQTLDPGQVPAQFFSYTYDILNQYRQLTSHVTDFTNAFPGVNNETATGARLAKSNADSIFSPMLGVKSEVRISTAQKTLSLHKKHFTGVKKWVSMGQTENHPIGRYVDGADVDDEIEFTVVRDSEQPKTNYDRQIDFVNMMATANQGGGYAILKQTEPKLTTALLKAFDIDLGEHDYDTITDVCESRMDEAFAMSDQIEQIKSEISKFGYEMPDLPIESILVGLSAPLVVEEPAHDQKARWFQEYLDHPDGFTQSQLKREVIRLFVRAHIQMHFEQMALLNSGMAATMPQDPNAQSPGDEQAAQMDAENRQMERDKEMKALDQQNKLELEDRKFSNMMEQKAAEAAMGKNVEPAAKK